MPLLMRKIVNTFSTIMWITLSLIYKLYEKLSP
jgi:hypothetical protein